MNYELNSIGKIITSKSGEQDTYNDELKDIATIIIYPDFVYGLMSLELGQEMTLLSWLHKAKRDILQIYPHNDKKLQKRGVFNTRSPVRPNPIGLHDVVIKRVKPLDDGCYELDVMPIKGFALDCIDGTPIIDLKTSSLQRKELLQKKQSDLIPTQEASLLKTHCYYAWQRKLMSGFNGNMSIKINTNTCLITSSGAIKKELDKTKLALVNISTASLVSGANPSSELAMHLEIYKIQPNANAIVHVHPPKMLALINKVSTNAFLNLDLFEAETFRKKLDLCPALPAGTIELALGVAKIASSHQAVFMKKHGLCTWGKTISEALALAEELELLAEIQLDTIEK